MTTSNADTRARDDLLDGLRFVAAMMVLLYHFAFRNWNQARPGHVEFAWLGPLTQYGYMGVDLFFMISGFVILMSAGRSGPKAFLRSRIVRLYPAYWCCVLLTFAFFRLWFSGSSNMPGWTDFLANLTMLQSFFGVGHIDGVYWTLVVELHFYALILLVLLSRQMDRIEAVLAAWLVTALVVDHWPQELYGLGEMIQVGWCHYFIAGAMAWRMRKLGINAWRLGIFSLAYLQAARHAHWYMALKARLTQLPHSPIVVQSLVALIFLIFLLLAFNRLQIQRPGLRSVGSLTYPLYLIHGGIGSTLLVHSVQAWGWHRSAALVSVTAFALATAWVIHVGVERPLAPWLRSKLTNGLTLR